MSEIGTAGAIRPGHELDEAALAAWLADHLAGFAGPLTVRQFRGGQSNPTFLLETPGANYVLRKKPPGKLLPRAHQIEREFRVMQALAGSAVPVPGALALCEDDRIIGTAFYVMSHVAGRVIEDPGLPDLAPEDRRAVWLAKIDALAELARLDWRAAGLENFGREGGYLTRQLAVWTRQYHASIEDVPPGPLAGMDRLEGWLTPRLAAVADATTLVHGDYRMGNMILDPARPRIAAVLDWELATLGHPLSDLAFLCLAYDLPGPAADLPLPGIGDRDLPGVPDEAYVVHRYQAATGYAADADWPVLKAFQCYRFAAICQGVHARSVKGNAADARAPRYRAVAETLAATGLDLSRG